MGSVLTDVNLFGGLLVSWYVSSITQKQLNRWKMCLSLEKISLTLGADPGIIFSLSLTLPDVFLYVC